MKYLGENKTDEELDNINWGIIETSKVNDKIIEILIDYFMRDISDNFFISFESLLKIGEKAKKKIKSVLEKKEDLKPFKRDLFNFIINYAENGYFEDEIILQLFNPDFIIRARAIMQINQSGNIAYLKYILPLLNDPDDSVRWAIIQLIESHNLINDTNIYFEVNKHLKVEQNATIRKKIMEIFEKKDS